MGYVSGTRMSSSNVPPAYTPSAGARRTARHVCRSASDAGRSAVTCSSFIDSAARTSCAKRRIAFPLPPLSIRHTTLSAAAVLSHAQKVEAPRVEDRSTSNTNVEFCPPLIFSTPNPFERHRCLESALHGACNHGVSTPLRCTHRMHPPIHRHHTQCKARRVRTRYKVCFPSLLLRRRRRPWQPVMHGFPHTPAWWAAQALHPPPHAVDGMRTQTVTIWYGPAQRRRDARPCHSHKRQTVRRPGPQVCTQRGHTLLQACAAKDRRHLALNRSTALLSKRRSITSHSRS